MKRIDKHIVVEALRFGIVGCINTAIDFLVFFPLVWVFNLHVVPANMCALSIAVTNSFFMNKYWSFRNRVSNLSTSRQLTTFVAVSIIGMGLSTLTVWWLASFIPLVLAKATSAVVSFAWNFFVSRHMVYRVA